MVVRIWPFGCTTLERLQVPATVPGLGPAGPAQGSETPGKLSLLPRKNSDTLGMRKPWDQLPRISRLSVACQRRAARPEALAAECSMPAMALPMLPPFHLN